MRTTVDLDDDLLPRLKRLAAESHTTLASILNDLLRKALAKPNARTPYKLKLRGWSGALPQGLNDDDISQRSRLYDLIEPAKRY